MSKARRIPTLSTVDDTTPPEAPARPPAAPPAEAPAEARQLEPVQPQPLAPSAPPGEQGVPPGVRQGDMRMASAIADLLLPPGGPAGVPRATDIIQPRVETPREQLNAMVPAQLKLRRRLRQYALDHEDDGVEVRDTVALAVDEWLRGRGY